MQKIALSLVSVLGVAVMSLGAIFMVASPEANADGPGARSQYCQYATGDVKNLIPCYSLAGADGNGIYRETATGRTLYCKRPMFPIAKQCRFI